MTDLPARPLWRGRVLAFVGVVLVAFSLRSAVASLSPILAEVRADIDVPTWVVGLIGTAPPVCFAVFGIVTPLLERRFGLERLAVAAMVIAAAALAGRALAADAALLLLGTTVLFAAVGVGNVVLPPLIKAYFPDRVGVMTALYSATLAVAAFLPPLVAVPIADASGWRFSLGLWSVFAALALVPWVTLLIRDRAQHRAVVVEPAPRVLGRLFRLPLAWALATSFAISSASVYTAFAWLPVILVDIAGVDHATAGALLALFSAIGLPLSFIVPLIVTRGRRIGVLYAVALVTGVLSVAGLILAPQAATVLWVVLLGIPQGLFPAMLVLIQLRARTREGSVALSGFTQSTGYAVAALFPISFALLHESTGSWTPPLLLIGALMLLAVPAGVIVTRGGTVEDAWERRHGAW
ncbi:MFS transporter [Microbacterium sp. W1N]|uniref:MFS transporter n=1 Tax=Microbacterium festucae TaxID=2977531 RepID=UPI0021C12508|nr:MFS transporter [Microbacterium festucae]MCT9819321.1 MFS transporter [Microbacterium festucae]